VQLVIGTSRSNWNVEDVTANNSSTPAQIHSSTPAQVQIFINDVTTICLDSLADLQINWIKISINSVSMTQRKSFNWIDLN